MVGQDYACSYDYQDLELEFKTYEQNTEEVYYERMQKLILKVEAIFVSRTASMARDLFQKNRQSIAQGDERALLKHVGVGPEVYTCMLLLSGASYGLAPFSIEMAGQMWDYHIVNLTSDEAAVFDTVQELSEGMAKLRVGGDDETIW